MASDSTRWAVHGTRRVYASEWVNVDLDTVEIPGGPRFEHHVLRFPQASTGAVVVDRNRDRVLLLRRHRFTTDRSGWEIPAGWTEPGEPPADAIAREILEETGHRVGAVTPLITYSPLTGISDQLYHVFLATDAHPVDTPDPAEANTVAWIALRDVARLLRAGEITDGPTLTALTTYLTLHPTPPAPAAGNTAPHPTA